MSAIGFGEEVLDQLRRRHPRYHEAAYAFVLAALQFVIARLPDPRHITGPELAAGVRDLALEQFGPMARTVLEYWGISSTGDMGELVFALVECGILIKQDGDSQEDFVGVYEFDEVFSEEYPWGAAL